MIEYLLVVVNGDNVFAVLHYAGAPDADPKAQPGKASGTK
jgi:hypothetical protein